MICTDCLIYYFRYGDKVTKSFFGRLIIIAWTIFGVTFIGLIISFLSEAVVHSAQYSNRSITATKVRKREIYDRLFCPLNLYSSNNRLQSLREKCPNTEFFPVFGINTKIYFVNHRIQSEYRKYGPEKTPYLDTFRAVNPILYFRAN